MDGRKVSITDDLCAQLAATYNPQRHEALISLDHAESGPAHGRIPRVYAVPGSGLYADYADVPADAAKAFQHGGAYPKRSAEIIQLDGQPYLGTNSHLGAKRPAIKNLAPILPSQITEQPALTAQLGELAQGNAWIFSEEIQEQPMTPEDNGAAVALAEKVGTLESEKATLLAENEAKARKLKEYEERDALRLAEQKFAEAQSTALKFAESTEIKPKLGNQSALAAALIATAETSGLTVRFGEGSQPFGEALRTMLSGLPASLPKAGVGRLPDAGKADADEDEPLEIKTGKQARAYLSEHNPHALALGERMADGAEKEAHLISLAKRIQNEKEREA